MGGVEAAAGGAVDGEFECGATGAEVPVVGPIALMGGEGFGGLFGKTGDDGFGGDDADAGGALFVIPLAHHAGEIGAGWVVVAEVGMG